MVALVRLSDDEATTHRTGAGKRTTNKQSFRTRRSRTRMSTATHQGMAAYSGIHRKNKFNGLVSRYPTILRKQCLLKLIAFKRQMRLSIKDCSKQTKNATVDSIDYQIPVNYHEIATFIRRDRYTDRQTGIA